MKTATLIRSVSGYLGVASLYRLAPPVKPSGAGEGLSSIEYVVVSSVAGGGASRDGLALIVPVETCVFVADADGNTGTYAVMDDLRNTMDHAAALRRIGYELQPIEETMNVGHTTPAKRLTLDELAYAAAADTYHEVSLDHHRSMARELLLLRAPEATTKTEGNEGENHEDHRKD